MSTFIPNFTKSISTSKRNRNSSNVIENVMEKPIDNKERDIMKMQSACKRIIYCFRLFLKLFKRLKRQGKRIKPISQSKDETAKTIKRSWSASEKHGKCFLDEEERSLNSMIFVIFSAIYYRDKTLLKELLCSHSIDVNNLNEDGISAMHFAAIVGSVQCMQVLLEHGAFLESVDLRGQTPMHYAFIMENTGAVEWLRENGAVN